MISFILQKCYVRRALLQIILSMAICSNCLAQSGKGKLVYKTSKSQEVAVYKGSIFVGKEMRYTLREDVVLYDSKKTKLIENSGSSFLFLEIDDSPNKNKFYIFKISNGKVDSIGMSISSDIRDVDGDGNLEFGGCDWTEVHPSKDSMYYIPSDYFELKNGKIIYDSSLTKKIDIQVNGLYLPNPADANGNCCRVIPKPAKKKRN